MQTLPLLCLLTMWLAPNAAEAVPVAPSQPATTASACTATASAPDVAGSFTVGTLRVERYGEHGRPVILIPGLESGTWTWTGTIEHLRDDHVVYAVTLAGFDGVPAPAKKTGLLDQADASLLRLIEEHHIDHPVLVGHSIGGTLAIRFAGEHNDLLSGVVAVEGLPVFPGWQNLTAKQRHARAATMKKRIASMTPAQFKTQQMNYMKYMGVIDPAKAACYARHMAKSDQAATAEYMAEDYAADDRPGLKQVTVPLLEIVPFYAKDAKMAAARTGQPARTAQEKAAFYGTLLANDPTAKVVTVTPSRHFAMLDQPARFRQVLENFLSGLPGVETP